MCHEQTHTHSEFILEAVSNKPPSHTPSWVLVLPVDTDGLSPGVPLVVIEKSTVLGACHVVMSVRLYCRHWRRSRKERKRQRGFKTSDGDRVRLKEIKSLLKKEGVSSEHKVLSQNPSCVSAG